MGSDREAHCTAILFLSEDGLAPSQRGLSFRILAPARR